MTPTHDSDEDPMESTLAPSDLDQQFADELLIGELTAALAAEADSEADALPPSLAVLAVQSGEAMVRAQRIATAETPGAAQPPSPAEHAVRAKRQAAAVRVAPVAPLRLVTVWGGWLAAAAMMAVMVAGGGATGAVDVDGAAAQAQPEVTLSSVDQAALSAALLDSLVANDAALRRGTFNGTEDPAGVGATGEVLWSGDAQRGVMRLVGLQPNDRTRLQYQLWIFDKARDQRYPVDGGVFDVPAGATEVLVPINARVPVGEAAMFAVTVEPAGGVVVSTRERIALLAEL